MGTRTPPTRTMATETLANGGSAKQTEWTAARKSMRPDTTEQMRRSFTQWHGLSVTRQWQEKIGRSSTMKFVVNVSERRRDGRGAYICWTKIKLSERRMSVKK